MSNQERVNLEIDSVTLNLIDRAAKTQGRSRTQYIVDTALQNAKLILKDKKIFYFSDEDWQQINKPNPTPNSKIAKILQRTPIWEK